MTTKNHLFTANDIFDILEHLFHQDEIAVSFFESPKRRPVDNETRSKLYSELKYRHALEIFKTFAEAINKKNQRKLELNKEIQHD